MNTFIKIHDIKLTKSEKPLVIQAKLIKASDGQIYYGKNVIPNSDKHKESENAKWLSLLLHTDVYIMPEIKQTESIKRVRSYDYLLDDSDERWDCKADISGSSKRLFKNNMSFHQATSYLFDINNCKMPDGTKMKDDYVENIVSYTFKTEKWVNYLIIKDGDRLIGIYKNINK